MAITFTKSWNSGDTVTASDLNANFTDVANKFNAGITSADLSTSNAGITNDQLANSDYEFVVNMTVNSAQWAAAADGDVVAVCGLPADVNSTSYTILKGTYLYVNNATASSGTPDFKVDFGYFSGGSWQQTTGLVTTEVGITASTAVNGALTLATSTVTTSTTNHEFFAIIASDVIDGATRPFGAADEFLTVTLKLKRTNGLR
jgi:hypothetical protein